MPSDTLLCCLPLSMSANRWLVYSVLLSGGRVQFHNELETLSDQLEDLRPSLLLACPYLLHQLYHQIRDQFSSQTGLNEVLLSKAL